MCPAITWMVTGIQMRKLHSGRKIVKLCLAGNHELIHIPYLYNISHNNCRPSPKKDVKAAQRSKTTANTSFQDFQESVSDAWELDDDDFCVISGKI